MKFKGILQIECSQCHSFFEIVIYEDADGIIQCEKVYRDENGVYQVIREEGD